MPDMSSGYVELNKPRSYLEYLFDAMSDVKKLTVCVYNHLPNFSKWGIRYSRYFNWIQKKIFASFVLLWIWLIDNNNWRLVCRSYAIDCSIEFFQLFGASHGVIKRCHTWHRVILALNKPMPCLLSFFDAISCVKKMTTVTHAINCSISAFEPSIDEKNDEWKEIIIT